MMNSIKEFVLLVNANGEACFWIAVFGMSFLFWLSGLLISLVRSATGHYPPAYRPQEEEEDQ